MSARQVRQKLLAALTDGNFFVRVRSLQPSSTFHASGTCSDTQDGRRIGELISEALDLTPSLFQGLQLVAVTSPGLHIGRASSNDESVIFNHLNLTIGQLHLNFLLIAANVRQLGLLERNVLRTVALDSILIQDRQLIKVHFVSERLVVAADKLEMLILVDQHDLELFASLVILEQGPRRNLTAKRSSHNDNLLKSLKLFALTSSHSQK